MAEMFDMSDAEMPDEKLREIFAESAHVRGFMVFSTQTLYGDKNGVPDSIGTEMFVWMQDVDGNELGVVMPLNVFDAYTEACMKANIVENYGAPYADVMDDNG